MISSRTLAVSASALAVAALTWVPVRATTTAGFRYAIVGARIVTGAGQTIDKGTIVMRDGLIEDIGAGVSAPADAITVDGSGLTAYPGLIDMSNTASVETPAPASGTGRGAAPAAGRGGGRGADTQTGEESYADVERAKRSASLNADVLASEHVKYDGDEMKRFASAGITSVLAVPGGGIFRGQSALVNVLAEPEGDEISGVGADRHGLVVIKSPVAQHVTFAGRGGAGGYPGTLLGTIAFVRQTFYDAQWQHTARAFADRHKDAPLPAFEPVLDSLQPALEGKQPVAFEAGEEREIMRALAMAKEFNLDPIIVGASDSMAVVDDLKAAHARVILSVATGAAGAGGRGGRGGGAETPLRVLHATQNAPKVAAALEKAGIPYAFTSEGLQTPGDFLRTVGRSVREGGLAPDAALRALTSGAARMAGAGDRVGTLEKGRIANVVLTDGDLFADRTQIKGVFVGGRQVEIGAAQPSNTGRGGRGGGAY